MKIYEYDRNDGKINFFIRYEIKGMVPTLGKNIMKE
jgi:hypothetical protein